MNLKEYKLGDLIRIKHGFAFKGKYISQEDNSVVLVTPGNFQIGGGFQDEKCKFYKGPIHNEYILKSGDFILTMTDLSKAGDTLGFSALVPNSERKYLHNQRIGLVSMISNECDRDYLYWMMRSYDYQRAIANTATGATVKHTSPTKIYEYKFKAPEKSTQIKIANILTTFENLIKVNQRKIKLIEESATAIYKEWFLNLQFPGYEKFKTDESISLYWEDKKIKDIGKVITGKTPPTSNSNYYSGDIPFVKIPDMHGRIYPLSTQTKLTVEGANYQINKYLPPNSILVSCIGTVGLVCINHEVCQTNQQINSIVPHEKNMLYYLFFVMRDTKSLLEGVGSNGATMTNVNKAKFESISIKIPCNELLTKFNNIVEPFFNSILVISKHTNRLIDTRDILIQKLMNREIEV